MCEINEKKPVTSVTIVIFSMWRLTNRDECKNWKPPADYISDATEIVLNKCVNNDDSQSYIHNYPFAKKQQQNNPPPPKKPPLYLMTID